MTNSTGISKIPTAIVVLTDSSEDMTWAESLAQKLKINVIKEMPDKENKDLMLCLDSHGLSLASNGKSMRGDFTSMLSRLMPNNLNGELLVKAAKLKGFQGVPTAIDATAGLGEDALLLSAAGFSVKLYERDIVIAALLRDALQRAVEVPELTEIVGRMRLIEGDSMTKMLQLETPPDVILLDPMFPARQKSGLIKKKFQLLQQLEQPCSDEEELLQAALTIHPRKVIIKRPLKGAYLADRKPDFSLKGKAIRYDCIVMPRNEEFF